jgi:hypothetical protein
VDIPGSKPEEPGYNHWKENIKSIPIKTNLVKKHTGLFGIARILPYCTEPLLRV